MAKTIKNPLAEATAEKYKRVWQTLSSVQISDALIAYDTADAQTERLVATYLDGKVLQNLVKEADTRLKRGEKIELAVHLGVDDKLLDGTVPDQPALQVMIPIWSAGTAINDNNYLLQWESNPQLPGSSTDNPTDAIPPESAYLFVYKWLESPLEYLGDLFEASAGLLGKRVKSYYYGHDETKDMISRLQNLGTDGRLSIYMGSGISVYRHPVAFRPVIELSRFVAGTRRTAQDGDDGGTFFDFSRPCPPYCKP